MAHLSSLDLLTNVYQENIWALLADGWMELKCLLVDLQLTFSFLWYVSLIIHLCKFITQQHPMEPWPHPTDIPVIFSLICGYIISLLELISTIQKYVLLHFFFFSKLHDYHSLDGCSYCNIYLSLFTHEPSLLTGCFIFCPLEHLFGLWDWSRAYFEWYMERQEWKNWTGGSTPHPNFQHHNFLSKYQSFNYYILMERPQWGDEQSKVVWGHFHHEVHSFGQSDISFFFIFLSHQTYRYSKFFFFY